MKCVIALLGLDFGLLCEWTMGEDW